MRLLLDTNAFLWWMIEDPTLDDHARAAIEDSDSFVAISAAVAWEIAIKQAIGKLRAPEDLEGGILKGGFEPLPITIEHAIHSGALPPHHRDPFDRMLVAQARLEGLTIVTRDPNIPRYNVSTLAA